MDLAAFVSDNPVATIVMLVLGGLAIAVAIVREARKGR